MNSPLKYRPEIDGLRAIAVLSVVLYHAQIALGEHKLLSGGFIGVDVFFVISGYLISTIVVRDIANNSFSIANFYERRGRRILPALFTVILASAPLAWMVLLPKAFKEYAWSILASLGFASNFLFWQEDSYTAEPSLLKPFLHTWSLSVEEQFYLFFPLLMLLLWRFAKPLLVPIVAALFLASLATAEIGSRAFSDANFFLLPSRAWEMLIGTLIAVQELVRNGRYPSILFKKPQLSEFVQNFLPKLGLVLIIGSLLLFDGSTPHPSLLTVFPIVGCVLIIQFANPAELVTRCLSARIMTSVGLISYSLYLWHFPLFAFARVQNILHGNVDKLLIIVLSIGLAILSYLFIEKPFRDRHKINSKRLLLILSVLMMLITGIQLAIIKSDGAAFRLGAVANLFEKASLRTVPNGNYGGFAERPSLLNVGDSHAEVLTSNLQAIAKRNKLNFTQVIESGCPLVVGLLRYDDGKLQQRCSDDLNQRRLDAVKSYKDSIIVFSARWNLYLQGQRFDDKQGNVEPGFELLLTTQTTPTPDAVGVAAALKDTINELLENQQKVVLVYAIPEVGWHVPNRIKRELDGVSYGQKLASFEKLNLTTSKSRFYERSKASYQLYDSVGEHPNLLRVYPADLLCSAVSNDCHTHDKIQLYYYDDNHLTHPAAGLIVRQIEKLSRERGWIN